MSAIRLFVTAYLFLNLLLCNSFASQPSYGKRIADNPFITGQINQKKAAPKAPEAPEAPTTFIKQCTPVCEAKVTDYFQGIYTHACQAGGEAKKRIEATIARFKRAKIARQYGDINLDEITLKELKKIDATRGSEEAAKMRARAASPAKRAEIKRLIAAIDSSCSAANIRLISQPDVDNNSSYINISGARALIANGERSNPFEAHMQCMYHCKANPAEYLGPLKTK